MNNIALITGASSGIGKAFAEKFASMGYDVVMVARREDRLISIANDLINKYSVNAEVLQADLSRDEGIEKVEDRIKKTKGLKVLINNAGFIIPGKLQEQDAKEITEMINVHINATTRLSMAAIPGMKKLESGLIINLSNRLCFMPLGFFVTYNSTKAYINYFSQSLQLELQDTNIKVKSLCPGLIRSELHSPEKFGDFESDKPSFLFMNCEEVVEKTIKSIKNKSVIIIPGLINKLAVWLKPISSRIMNHKNKTCN